MVSDLKGSKKFKESLPHGIIKKIAASFGYKSAGGVGEVLGGSKNGNPLVLECADRIIEAYKNCGFEQDVKLILKDYKNAANK